MTPGTHAIAVLATTIGAAAAFAGSPAAQNRDREPSRLVWAAKPVPPTPYVPPNRLIWRIADILAAHNGQASWRQFVAVTRDFEGEWVSRFTTPSMTFTKMRHLAFVHRAANFGDLRV